MTQFTPRSFLLGTEMQGLYLRLPFQLATPPGFHATHIPKGNLALMYDIYLEQSFSSSKPPAAAAVAVGHTRPRSASLYDRLVGLTLEPFVQVPDLSRVSWFRTRNSAYNLKTKNLHLTCLFNRLSLS